MGQKNFAHGHATLIVGVILLIIGVIIYLSESSRIFGNTTWGWVLIGIGAFLIFIGAFSFGIHAKGKEPHTETPPGSESAAGEHKESESGTATEVRIEPVQL
jgi:hypothetical protein